MDCFWAAWLHWRIAAARSQSPLRGTPASSVQGCGCGGLETLVVPAAPAGQVPGEELALAADGEALVGALAVGLHGLLTDGEVQRDAHGGQAVQDARADF